MEWQNWNLTLVKEIASQKLYQTILLRQEARWLDLVVSKNQELNLWT
jgi:hypothetical protein